MLLRLPRNDLPRSAESVKASKEYQLSHWMYALAFTHIQGHLFPLLPVLVFVAKFSIH